MFYYLYKITNSINGKIYIGVHQTVDLADGYFGSGTALKKSIKKYGIENFTKEILEYFTTESDMFAREKEIVTEQFINSVHTYNMALGGAGTFFHINQLPNQGHSPNQQKRANAALNAKLQADPEFQKQYRQKLSEANRKRLDNGTHPFKTLPNPALEHKWVTNLETQIQKYIHVSDLDSYLSTGWVQGRKGGWGIRKNRSL